MGRIRTIKPEFPQSESIGKLSRDARLLFVQLWTIVDDEGRARAASRMLASLLYPYDDDAVHLIDGWMDELEQNRMVRRYEVDGSKYLEIVKWLDHQKIDKPSKSRLPPFVEASRSLSNIPEPSPADLGPRTMEEDHSLSVADAAEPCVSRFDEFWEVFPKRDGPNPRKPAEQKFCALVKTGVDPDLLIAAVKQLAADQTRRGNVGTRFVPQAITWLSEERWADQASAAFTTSTSTKMPIEEAITVFKQTGKWSRYAPVADISQAPPELLAKHGLMPDGRRIQ